MFEIVLNLHKYINQLDSIYQKATEDKNAYTFQSVAIQYSDYIYDLQNENSIHKKLELSEAQIITKAKQEYTDWAFTKKV